MKKMKRIALALWRLRGLKYVFVIIVGIALVGFLDDNSIWAHIRNMNRISELQKEIDDYTQRYERDQARVRQLNVNPKAVERIARERYFMKEADEDIFMLSEDVNHDSNDYYDNETTE